MKPISQKPQSQADEEFSGNGAPAAVNNDNSSVESKTQRLQPVEDSIPILTDATVSPPSDATRRQIPVKVPNEAAPIKVSADAEARNITYKKKKSTPEQVKISARNRNAAEMDPIFRKEARMTEVPGGRRYLSFFYRLQRRGPAKQYRLKGYANRNYVKQRRKQNQKFQNRANIFFWVLIAIIFLIVFYWIDPIDKIQELMRLVGM